MGLKFNYFAPKGRITFALGGAQENGKWKKNVYRTMGVKIQTYR